MNFDWWTLGLQTINALVLVGLLSYFLFRPVADIIAERQKAANRLIAEAQAAKEGAQAERVKAEAEAVSLADHRKDALKAVDAEAEKEKAKLLETARADADKLRADAQTEIAAQRRAEEAAEEDHAGELALDIAAKLLDRLPSEVRVDAFIKGLTSGVSSLPDATRATLGANGTAIHLIAARSLTAPETEACRTGLAEVLGRPIEIDFSVDPALVAGIELEAPDATVRNSFRADLLRLKSRLVGHDNHAN
jgi:F-type H+-transporting ATPase subunit b